MTIVELKKELAEALVSLNRGDSVTAKRVMHSARAAKGGRASPTVEIAIVVANPAHARSGRSGPAPFAPPRCGTSPLRKRVPSTGSVVQRSQTFRNPQTRLSPAE